MRRRSASARRRILETAYSLFATEGVQAVGVDRVVSEAGVAKMTLYRHFPSKDALVAATLELREELWTYKWLMAEVERRATTPRDQLAAIFDAFDEWFQRDDYEACMFISTLVESRGARNRNGDTAAQHLETVRGLVRGLAERAGVREPDRFASCWQILMSGAMVQAAQGHRDAARMARGTAMLLLARELG
jgi:AcrR family transcriptional regulator